LLFFLFPAFDLRTAFCQSAGSGYLLHDVRRQRAAVFLKLIDIHHGSLLAAEHRLAG
jgi:hypothetical protein